MNIEDILLKISKLEVLVVGDLMIDRYIKGKVERVSPEAPVPIVECIAEENRLGGAANVAKNIVQLGANVKLCGFLGHDEESILFKKLMDENNLDTSLVLNSTERPTTTKTRVLSNDQQLLRLDKEVKKDLSVSEREHLLSKLKTHFTENKIDICILQDYNKGVLSKEVINAILNLANKAHVPIAVDPKFNNFWEYRNVQLFKPNLKEILGALPFQIDLSLPSLVKGANYIKKELNVDFLLLTLSENGVFVSGSGINEVFPTDKRQVADVCGAGDAVIAIASMAMCIGLSTKEIAVLTNLVGGQVVEKVGVVTVDKEQLVKEVKNQLDQFLP